MKLALLGDIHGNADALAAVLDSARANGAELLLVTGDLVGYYFEPKKVLTLLDSFPKHIVRGNHEDMLIAGRANGAGLDEVRKRYGTGVEVALAELDENELDMLCGLPHPFRTDIGGCRILLCHGAPWDVDQYVYPNAPDSLLERFADPGLDLIVTGHTHYPMAKRIGDTLLVNPGSVGQPRNRQPGAQWALFDTDTRHVEFKRESYDARPLIEECKKRHPEIPYLSDVLERTE